MTKGKKVGVVGLGGLGHMGVKLARAFGAHVVVFTTSPEKQEDALRLFLKRTCRHRTVCVQLDACQDDLAPACVDGGCVARIAPRGGATPLAPSASGAWANDG